jgi:Na+-driven multidrug efflux pump
MNFLLPGVLLLTIFKVMNMDLAGKGKPWISMYAMLPALIINIVLNIVLIPNFGANGAAIASTISYSVAALLFLFFYSKTVNVPIKTILHFQKSDFLPLLKIIKKLNK